MLVGALQDSLNCSGAFTAYHLDRTMDMESGSPKTIVGLVGPIAELKFNFQASEMALGGFRNG